MKVDLDLCIGCGECVPYCPMSALSAESGQATVDRAECVECNICVNSGVCPVGALAAEDELPWPRAVRRVFSDPLRPHSLTGVPGRGTEEIKTNDVTGRVRQGRVGVAAELGRPGVGAHFSDVQVVSSAVAPLGVAFEEKNPVTSFIIDRATGLLDPELLGEKVLSAIVEFEIPLDQLAATLAAIGQAAKAVQTVFSLDVACVDQDRQAVEAIMRVAGFHFLPNGKTNVGLGRPLAFGGER